MALFPYYGGKGLLVQKYPAPYYDHIIEPFAGGAQYALRHGARRAVTIYDVDPQVIAVWRFLLAASPEDLLRLPVLGRGERISAVSSLTDAERWFLGLWASPGSSGGWANDMISERGAQHGWARHRERVARDVERIRHWQVELGQYTDATCPTAATWFIDPPYQGGDTTAGAGYHHGKGALDYEALGAWTLSRPGQVIACDHEDASWLPFRPLVSSQRQTNDEWRTELVYLQGPQPMTDRLGRVQRRRRPGEMIMRYPGGR